MQLLKSCSQSICVATCVGRPATVLQQSQEGFADQTVLRRPCGARRLTSVQFGASSILCCAGLCGQKGKLQERVACVQLLAGAFMRT